MGWFNPFAGRNRVKLKRLSESSLLIILQQFDNSSIYRKQKGWKLLWKFCLIKSNTATLFLAGFISLKALCAALCCCSTRAQLPQASLQYSALQLSSPDYPTYVSLSCSCLKCPDGQGGNRKVLYREKTEYSLKKQMCAPHNIQLSMGHPVI